MYLVNPTLFEPDLYLKIHHSTRTYGRTYQDANLVGAEDSDAKDIPMIEDMPEDTRPPKYETLVNTVT